METGDAASGALTEVANIPTSIGAYGTPGDYFNGLIDESLQLNIPWVHQLPLLRNIRKPIKSR